MSLAQKLRACDKYGATINFTYTREETYKTLFGGLVSLSLRVLIFSYFVIQLLSVIEYKDPTTSTQEILVDRAQNSESFNAKDYKLKFQVAFQDSSYRPVELDWRIGTF